MSKTLSPRVGTSYTHQHVNLRTQNPLYQKTDPARFAFNGTAKSNQQSQQQIGGSREQRKAAFITRRQNQPTHQRNQERTVNGQ